MPTPIFVYGIHRSGTTWLANQISQHTQIAAVRHELHFGLHESAFFEFIDGRYGDLSNRENYIEFVEVMAASDYFMLAGISKEFLYSLYPTTYEGCFRAIMDDFAQREEAAFWLEKTPAHTLVIDKIGKLYPDSLGIGIERDIEEMTASSLLRDPVYHKGMIAHYLFITRLTVRLVYYRKLMENFKAKHPNRMLLVKYKDVVTNIDGVMQEICKFLNVPFEKEMAVQEFRPDTSYKKFDQKEEVLTPAEKRFARMLLNITRSIPVFILKPFFQQSLRSRLSSPLPGWFFRITRANEKDKAPSVQIREFEEIGS